MKLPIYTFERCAAAVLQRRMPRVPPCTLTRWFASGPGRDRRRAIDYYVNRARANHAMMEQLDLVKRTAELARVFGIDFYSVISRGSQFRVESMLLRLAHAQNYLMLSPSRYILFPLS